MVNNFLSAAALSEKMVSALNSSLGIWYMVIVNAIGVIAIICKILEYQVSTRGKMFTCATIANICWVLYFALYGNFPGALTCTVNVIKMFIFMQRGKHKWADSILWLIVFLIAQAMVAIFTMRYWYDVFSITAGFLGIFAYFVTDQKRYRLLSFFHMALWVANSIANGIAFGIAFYLIAILSDSFSTVSCAVAIYRYDLSKKARKLNKTVVSESEQEQTVNE